MDELDRAQMMEEKEREAALLLRKPVLKPVGVCWYCGEPVHSESLFCDIDCRNDYEKEQEAKKRNGT